MRTIILAAALALAPMAASAYGGRESLQQSDQDAGGYDHRGAGRWGNGGLGRAPGGCGCQNSAGRLSGPV